MMVLLMVLVSHFRFCRFRQEGKPLFVRTSAGHARSFGVLKFKGLEWEPQTRNPKIKRFSV